MIRPIRKIKNAIQNASRAMLFLRAPGKYYAQVRELKRQGMKIGENVRILHDTILDASRPFLIEIGNNVTFAPRCHVLTHDASMCTFQNRTRIGKVKILDNCFIGAGTIILPGVTVGPNAIIGAGSVVTRDVTEGTVVAGNPARRICSLRDFLEKHERECTPQNSYPYDRFHGQFITEPDAKRMASELDQRCGYSTQCRA